MKKKLMVGALNFKLTTVSSLCFLSRFTRVAGLHPSHTPAVAGGGGVAEVAAVKAAAKAAARAKITTARNS